MLKTLFFAVHSFIFLGSTIFAQTEVVPIPTPSASQSTENAFHSGWAVLQVDGSLKGRAVVLGPAGELVPQANAKITLSQNLAVLSTTQSNAEGEFTLGGLSEGVYEIASETADSFGIVSFEAVSGTSTPTAMQVFASSMPRNAVDEVLKGMWAPQEEGIGAPKFEDVIATMVPGTQSQRVAIRDGRIFGQVAFSDSRNIPEAHVIKVFRAGSLEATAPVDSSGMFSFPVTAPGAIDIVLGGSAYAILGFEAVDRQQLAETPSLEQRFVAAAMQDVCVADTLVVPAVGCGTPLPPVIVEEQAPLLAAAPPAPMCCGFSPSAGFRGGGFSGGGGYGGGGAGGFGSLAGGLLGAAGLAVGVAALLDDDDDDDRNRNDGFNVGFATPFR